MLESKTDILFFNKEGEVKKQKDNVILKSFMYNRNNFTLLKKSNWFIVCVNNDKNDLHQIWTLKNNDYNANEVLSIFRKEYDKNNITTDLIKKFLKEPLKYTCLKSEKKKRNKKKKEN